MANKKRRASLNQRTAMTMSKKFGGALFRKSQTRRRSSGIQTQSRMFCRAKAAISSSNFCLVKKLPWISCAERRQADRQHSRVDKRTMTTNEREIHTRNI